MVVAIWENPEKHIPDGKDGGDGGFKDIENHWAKPRGRLPIFCVNGVGVFMGLKCGDDKRTKRDYWDYSLYCF